MQKLNILFNTRSPTFPVGLASYYPRTSTTHNPTMEVKWHEAARKEMDVLSVFKKNNDRRFNTNARTM